MMQRQLSRLTSLIQTQPQPFHSSLLALYSTITHDLGVLVAQPREESGSIAASKIRRSDRIPGILFSLPKEESMLLTFDKNDISYALNKLGRTGWACHVFEVRIPSTSTTTTNNDSDTTHTNTEYTSYRALGRQVHLTAATDEIENVTLMYCPPDRKVKVNIPLKVYGEELSPGLKAGGRINWIERTISCTARGDTIPEKFEVDISGLAVNDKLYYTDLKLPDGVELTVKDVSLPILKIQRK